MMHQKSKSTVVSLANAATLATGIVHRVAGTQVSNTLNGSKATREVLADLISSRIAAKFSNHTSRSAK